MKFLDVKASIIDWLKLAWIYVEVGTHTKSEHWCSLVALKNPGFAKRWSLKTDQQMGHLGLCLPSSFQFLTN